MKRKKNRWLIARTRCTIYNTFIFIFCVFSLRFSYCTTAHADNAPARGRTHMFILDLLSLAAASDFWWDMLWFVKYSLIFSNNCFNILVDCLINRHECSVINSKILWFVCICPLFSVHICRFICLHFFYESQIKEMHSGELSKENPHFLFHCFEYEQNRLPYFLFRSLPLSDLERNALNRSSSLMSS